MTHARVVCHNPPRPHIVSLSHYLALRTRSHTASLYLVLILSHVRFLTSCHMVSSSVNVSHRLALFPIHLTVCRATGQFDTEPRMHGSTHHSTHRYTHCCRSSCCCTHTVAPTTAALLMHHTAHRPSHHHCYTNTAPGIQHTTRHTNLCCTNHYCTDHCCTNHCCTSHGCTSHAAPYIVRCTK